MRRFKRKQEKINGKRAGSIFGVGALKRFGPLLLFGLSTISYYLAWWTFSKGVGLILQVILKFIIYLSVIVWLNSAFYMRELALGTDVDTRNFQKRQVIMTMWIFSMFILIEIPTWLTVFSSH